MGSGERMNRRSGCIAVLALLFAVATLLPVAAADHTYSHRYIVFGRVVDANDNPVQGVTVDLGYKDFEPDGACVRQPNTETEAFGETTTKPVTNQYGEFTFCFHTHSMSRALPGTGILRVPDPADPTASLVEQEFRLDPYTRHSFQLLRLDEPSDAANPDVLESAYTIQGNAWRSAGGETYLDSVRVFGLALENAPVNITFTYNGREPVTLNATTNGYGDFAIRVPVEERPTTGEVTIEVANETFTEPVNPYGVTAFAVELEEQDDPFVQKFLLGAGIVLGIAVVGGAAWYGGRKMKENREESLVRERSQRKRAKK